MEILLTLIYLLLFIWLISGSPFFKLDGIPRIWISLAFLLKVIAGVLFWYIYTFYYTSRSDADIYKYFDDSKILFDALKNNPQDFIRMFFGFDNDPRFYEQYYAHMQVWKPQFESAVSMESHTMIRLNVVFRFFSFGFYQLHNVFVNFLSFAGLVALYKTFVPYAADKRKFLFPAIFLPPTVLFWGSGLIRESLVFFTMGFSVYFCHKLITEKLSWKTVVWSVLFLWLLLISKIVLCGLLIIGFVAWGISLHMLKRVPVLNFILAGVIAFTGLLLLAQFTGRNYFRVMQVKQVDLINVSNGGYYLVNGNKMIYIAYDKRDASLEMLRDSTYKIKPGSDYYYYNQPDSKDTIYVHNSTDTLAYKLFSSSAPSKTKFPIPLLTEDKWSFIKTAPRAFFVALARPFIWEAKNNLQRLAAIENILLMLAGLFCLIFADRTVFAKPAFWFCILMVVCFYCMIGWVTPFFGGLVRYKAVVFPFLMSALTIMFKRSKMSK